MPAAAWQARLMIRRAPGLLFIAACLAAIAMRAVLPAGWMPAASQGAIFTICSVAGDDGGLPAPGDAAGACDFALALGPAVAAAALLLPLLLLPLLPVPVPRPVRQHARRHPARPFGQGPPCP
jgi:hypothetical protein